MRIPIHASLSVLFLAACGGADDTSGDAPMAAAPPAWCEGNTTHQWDPSGAAHVELFPDGLLEVVDPGSPTGMRLDPDRVAWPAQVPPLLAEAVLAMTALSGFGTLGGGLLRFDAPVQDVPATAAASESASGWRLVDLDAPTPTRVPFEAELLDGGQTVRLWPLRPLRQGARHALVVTTDAAAVSRPPQQRVRCSTGIPWTPSSQTPLPATAPRSTRWS